MLVKNNNKLLEEVSSLFDKDISNNLICLNFITQIEYIETFLSKRTNTMEKLLSDPYLILNSIPSDKSILPELFRLPSTTEEINKDNILKFLMLHQALPKILSKGSYEGFPKELHLDNSALNISAVDLINSNKLATECFEYADFKLKFRLLIEDEEGIIIVAPEYGMNPNSIRIIRKFKYINSVITMVGETNPKLRVESGKNSIELKFDTDHKVSKIYDIIKGQQEKYMKNTILFMKQYLDDSKL